MIADRIHQEILQETKKRIRTDRHFFSEELSKMRVIPFDKGIEKIIDRRFGEKDLLTASIIAYNPKTSGKIKYFLGKYLEPTNELYIRLDDFNVLWKMIRDSVSYGIWTNKKECNELGVFYPEDVVQLKHFMTDKREAFFSHREICFRSRNESDESYRLAALRQSKIDNKEAIFVYSTKCGVVHDKSCENIKFIPDENFEVSDTLPTGAVYCLKCMRRLLIRKGCFPNTKEIPICTRLLDDNNVSTETIQRVVEEGFFFHANSLGELAIKGKEDSWVISVHDGQPVLWHNNYVKISEKDRYIVDGFHNQDLSSYSVERMLIYTTMYSWKKHLARASDTNSYVCDMVRNT